MEAKSHWEGVYGSRPADTVSWYQPHATISLKLIRAMSMGPLTRIIDVGGGASTLVDDLLADGMSRVTVLDISEAALRVSQGRLGAQARRVRWIGADVTKVQLELGAYDIWHDRAVFHFLTQESDRAAYVSQVRRAVRRGGHVVVAAFGPNGPDRCSGLPVVRYEPGRLHAEFGGEFELIGHVAEAHRTPAGAIQQFVYCHCLLH
jgi:ubiquinone/menaquinone biosynthesis C-methylase UbiE